ncbi:MAG: aldehyde dehydrogenase family protein [Ilumatobacteraceae bacterium]
MFAGSLAGAFRGAASLLRTAGVRTELPGPVRPVELLRLPWGPAAVLVPWNAPAAMAAGKVAMALAAGCTVLLKPPEWSPLGCNLVADAIHRVELPAGVFQMVHGGPATGAALTGDPRVKVVSYTGSLAAGRDRTRRCRALHRAAARARRQQPGNRSRRCRHRRHRCGAGLGDAEAERPVVRGAGQGARRPSTPRRPRRRPARPPRPAAHRPPSRRHDRGRAAVARCAPRPAAPAGRRARRRRRRRADRRRSARSARLVLGTAPGGGGRPGPLRRRAVRAGRERAPGRRRRARGRAGERHAVRSGRLRVLVRPRRRPGARAADPFRRGEDQRHERDRPHAHQHQSFWGLSGIGGHGDAEVLRFFTGSQIVGVDHPDVPI